MRTCSQPISAIYVGSSFGKVRRSGTGLPRSRSLDPQQLGSIDWKREVAKAVELEANHWESRTLQATLRRMEMWEWLTHTPSMRPYMKKNFSLGWAPTSWHG